MSHLSDIEKQKREKLEEIKKLGVYPFGERTKETPPQKNW